MGVTPRFFSRPIYKNILNDEVDARSQRELNIGVLNLNSKGTETAS